MQIDHKTHYIPVGIIKTQVQDHLNQILTEINSKLAVTLNFNQISNDKNTIESLGN